MQIQLSEIPREGLELQFEMDPASLDLEDSGGPFVTPIQVRSRLDVIEGLVHVSGSANAQAKMQCVRCLEVLPLSVQASYKICLEPQESGSGNIPGEWRELHREELDQHAYSGGMIDLSELAREQILLALPTYPLCRPDCRGLCPICGGDRNRLLCQCEAEETRPPMTQFQERLKKIIKK